MGVSSTAGVAAKEPLVLLVDQQSASASEVLAAALRGNCRAPLLGTKTYGKAKVQGVFGLPNKEAITLSLRRGTAANPLKTWKESFSRSRTQAPQGKIDTGIIAGNLPEGHQVGYVLLRSFTARSAIDMADAVAQLRANGADELVLDLRGNLGGSFPAALEIAALFLQPDTVATRVQTPAVQDTPLRVSSTAGVAAKEPLVLLVDQQSASASEVLAAALRGNCRAPLLGTKT